MSVVYYIVHVYVINTLKKKKNHSTQTNHLIKIKPLDLKGIKQQHSSHNNSASLGLKKKCINIAQMQPSYQSRFWCLVRDYGITLTECPEIHPSLTGLSSQ